VYICAARCTAEKRYERPSPHGARPSSGLGPHITTPLLKNAAVHHSKNCALMSQLKSHGSEMARPVYLQQRTYLRSVATAVECQFQTLLGLYPDHLRWWARQPSEPAVWRGLLFVVLGLSLLLLLEPLGQPQPHLRHVV
jgi:hypothetical protein